MAKKNAQTQARTRSFFLFIFLSLSLSLSLFLTLIYLFCHFFILSFVHSLHFISFKTVGRGSRTAVSIAFLFLS